MLYPYLLQIKHDNEREDAPKNEPNLPHHRPCIAQPSIMSSNDLIIDEGFTVLNNFKPGSSSKDDESQSDPIPRFPFASFANALSMPSDALRTSFLNDCSLVFTARTKEDSDNYSTGSTYFLPCLMKPRCALEGLAHTIFRAHVDSLSGCEGLYDPERSGAEWWTLVLDTASSESSPPISHNDDDEDDDEEEDDEVGE